MRALFSGPEADSGGTSVSIPWRSDAGSELAIWVAAYGPKALDTIGRHADGFVLQLADPKILEWTLQAVRGSAAAWSFEGRPVEAVGGGDRLVGHLSLDDVDAAGEGRVAFRRRSPAAVGNLQGVGHRRVG